MVKIRLTRTGRKNNPSFRLVVTNAREKRGSNFIEFLGHYSPVTKEVVINDERAKYWLGVGAQPTDTVKLMFVKRGLVVAPKFKKTFKKEMGKKATERKKKAEK
jgi:small subunit ribosomal protein S16